MARDIEKYSVLFKIVSQKLRLKRRVSHMMRKALQMTRAPEIAKALHSSQLLIPYQSLRRHESIMINLKMLQPIARRKDATSESSLFGIFSLLKTVS